MKDCSSTWLNANFGSYCLHAMDFHLLSLRHFKISHIFVEEVIVCRLFRGII